ncbi:PREDICTED: 7-deoxyloganetic acid glucosyltransferase-like isoform X2 [Populus euphratica]|uniref:Glycosyltransferase n=1 Tax=Populus euphratica TaxID=75702 RepID=A0AAJ6TMG8_POPEU|nr:PREDICTED: 7-deoxyloganetic acid glucosyltransferase-like isoform X2 [Populus euphratica]
MVLRPNRSSTMDQPVVPHVVFLPFPAQGHVKPMLMLAELLSQAGFEATFINSNHIQHRLEHSINIATMYRRFPKFQFRSVTDGLPSDHPRSSSSIVQLLISARDETRTEFRNLLVNLGQKNGRWEPPTCIIADGIMSFAIDIAEELTIPVITFRTFSACCTWTYFHLTKLIEQGEVPFQGDVDMDKTITCIPGLEGTLRCRDLPGICRLKEANDPLLQFFIKETAAMPRAYGVILNTFDGLEASMVSKLGSFFSKIYTLGPLQGLFDTFAKSPSARTSFNGLLWKEDRGCISWLDFHPSRSVIYVSFGSLVCLVRDQLLEFWHGLVNSGKPFLWVLRSDSILGEDGVSEVPLELKAATEERGCIVDWAPQEEVLAHPAIGGFLTHSGWNSTLESIFAGVPMICWPMFADQQVNSRCVSELWKIGFDMKDKCERAVIEKLVRDLMESDEIVKSTDEFARMARDSVKEGGSSYSNLQKLIEDIKSISLAGKVSSSNAE